MSAAPERPDRVAHALRELVRATSFVDSAVRSEWAAGRKTLVVVDAQLSPERLLRLRAARDTAREALGETCLID